MTKSDKAVRRFQLHLIKPSHYDDDGYVIQWMRSSIPSNTLAALYGLAVDCRDRKVLGPDTDIDIIEADETNDRIRPERIAQSIERAGGFGMVGLVGVQSNQFPRAMDIARRLRARGIQVVMGGFHVSGCIAMLPGIQPDLQEALDLGISLYAGEAEGRLDEVLLDAAAHALKPIYNYMNDLPGLEGQPAPILGSERIARTAGGISSFDAGRGCPFQCSFCTIINVQGRKSRYRTADDIEDLIRRNIAQGVCRFFITDDNFARNRNWEQIFDRLIAMREAENLYFSFIIQVDTLCHKIPNFVTKAARAGVRRVFIGLENINPDNLIAAKKKQNRISEYRQMLLDWKSVGCFTYAGYIIGFPSDTKESVLRDIDIIKRELPLDLLEFFFLTPLPGSEDHKKLFLAGTAMEPDMNKYDLEHACTAHSKMSKAEWEQTYQLAWERYYTPEHMETILRRGMATRISPGKMMLLLVWFWGAVFIEKVHPLQAGYLRRRVRVDRRPGLPIENAFLFYPREAWSIVSKHARLAGTVMRLSRVRRQLKKDPNARNYMDEALTPVRDDEMDVLEMFNVNEAARTATAKIKRDAVRVAAKV
ncbi:MAG: B12-binding domain-containing radical SAM protein [Acetobacteraceae bacterium]|nr:B12-binding domain-containing radical SAM protein [Acetobacteraceae bacterium]